MILPVDAWIAVGVARPKAQGQAMTSMETHISTALFRGAWRPNQAREVSLVGEIVYVGVIPTNGEN